MHFDVAIIGGGPAGTAAVMTLRKRPDISVAIIERGQYATPKVGESLSPGVRGLLHYLGVWDRFAQEQTLRLFGSEAAWGQDTLGAMDFIFTSHGAGWVLDRQKFDLMLAEEAERAGAHLACGTKVILSEHDGEHWHLTTDRGAMTARYLIDAAGRTSPFSIAQGAARQRSDSLIAISARLPSGSLVAQMTRVESFEHGWWYAAPLSPGDVIVSLFTDAGRIHALGLSDPSVWSKHLQDANHISPLVDLSKQTPEIVAQPAFSGILQQGTRLPPMIAAGDAMAARDPLSSSGIPNAIGGGIQAGRVAADWLFGDGQLRQGYLRSVTLDHQAYLRTHWKTYHIEQRWPQAPFWRFRTAKVARTPDTKVRSKRVSAESIFVPVPAADWISKAAQMPVPQRELAQSARSTFPSITDERLLLAIEDLTEVAGL